MIFIDAVGMLVNGRAYAIRREVWLERFITADQPFNQWRLSEDDIKAGDWLYREVDGRWLR